MSMKGDDFCGVNLTGAAFIGVDLTGANFAGATTIGVYFGDQVICPDGQAASRSTSGAAACRM